jgi:MYXO-CTERM domain-containing protein
LSNTGGQPLSWTSTSDDSAVTVSAPSQSLAAGGGQTVQIAVAPSATAGTRTAHVTIDAGAAGSAVIAIDIAFTDPGNSGSGNTGTGSGGGQSAGGSGPSGTSATQAAHGCSHTGSTAGWLLVAGVLALGWRRVRRA